MRMVMVSVVSCGVPKRSSTITLPKGYSEKKVPWWVGGGKNAFVYIQSSWFKFLGCLPKFHGHSSAK